MTHEQKLARFAELDEQIKAMTKEKDKLKEELMFHYGMQESYLKEDMGYAVKLKMVESMIFDTKSFKESHEDIYKTFTRPSVKRTFTVEKIGKI